jgi:hypothetical protein
MSRHQSRRRRLYGRRLHELRERRERIGVIDESLESPAARGRVAIPIIANGRASEAGAGLGLAAVALD